MAPPAYSSSDMIRRSLGLIRPPPTCTKQARTLKLSPRSNMPSSKGKPTDPELREEIKEGKCFSAMHETRHNSQELTLSGRDQAGAEQVRRRRGPMGCVEGTRAESLAPRDDSLECSFANDHLLRLPS